MRRPRAPKIVGRLCQTQPDRNRRFTETPYKPAPLSRVFASIAKPTINHNLKNPFLKNLNEKSFNYSDRAARRGEHCDRAIRCYSWVEPYTIHFSNAGHGDG
jgi:hypothetical protein